MSKLGDVVATSDSVAKEEALRFLERGDLGSCYEAIRRYGRENIAAKMPSAPDDYYTHSDRLLRALPPSTSISNLEIRKVADEVRFGLLEWSYPECNPFAEAIYEILGVESGSYDSDELREITFSRLKPFFSR